MEKLNTTINNNLKNIIIILVSLWIFIIFLFLKIFRHYDFTAKYGIKKILCYEIFQNEYFLIDNNKNTTWGITEQHYQGEKITIEFKNNKIISDLSIQNEKYKDIPTPNIKIYFSDNTDSLNECKYFQKQVTSKLTHYTFTNKCSGKYLILEYNENKPNYWPITEIIL